MKMGVFKYFLNGFERVIHTNGDNVFAHYVFYFHEGGSWAI